MMLERKNLSSDLIKQAPTPPGVDVAIRNQLNRLRDRQEPKDDNNLSLPPPAPGTSRGFPLPLPPSFQPLSESFLDSSWPQQFRPDNSCGNFHIPAQLSSAYFNRNEKPSGNLFGSLTQVKEKVAEKFVQNSLQKELDDTIYELPDPPKLELGDGLLNTLGVQADDILEQKFVNQKQQEDTVLEQIKKEYNFDEIKDAFDEDTVLQQLDFFYGGENSNFNRAIKFLSPSKENREFIAFLLSDLGQNLMTNNSLSIHIESGDIFYLNFNTGENCYNFVIA